MYDCRYDLKDVERMNNDSIDIRLRMTIRNFKKFMEVNYEKV